MMKCNKAAATCFKK